MFERDLVAKGCNTYKHCVIAIVRIWILNLSCLRSERMSEPKQSNFENCFQTVIPQGALLHIFATYWGISNVTSGATRISFRGGKGQSFGSGPLCITGPRFSWNPTEPENISNVRGFKFSCFGNGPPRIGRLNPRRHRGVMHPPPPCGFSGISFLLTVWLSPFFL